jgi:hypothetical protein
MASSVFSANNFSNTPLGAEKAYIGTYDSVLQYGSATITLNTDTDCELIIYQSADKVSTISEVVPITSFPYTSIISLAQPYVYFTVRNTTSTDQTTFLFTVIYRSGVYVPDGTGLASTKIFDSAGNSLDSTSNALDVYVQNQISTPSSKTTQVWNSAVVSTGSTSTALSNGSSATQIITVFGTTTAPANYTSVVQFSNEGTTYYDSQYSYTTTAGGDFGFAIQGCAKFIRLKILTATAPLTISTFITTS